jgi:hypothetical protein
MLGFYVEWDTAAIRNWTDQSRAGYPVQMPAACLRPRRFQHRRRFLLRASQFVMVRQLSRVDRYRQECYRVRSISRNRMRAGSEMPDHLPNDDAELRAAITNHLGRSVLGMSTPEVARSVRRDALLVSATLRAMQQDGLVAFRRQRWRLTQEPAPQIGPVRTTPAAVVAEQHASSQDERRIQNSRWATFRRLCQYYAECVRLDQGTTIHGRDVDENQKFVCISGNLGWPDGSQPPKFSMPIPTEWAEFLVFCRYVEADELDANTAGRGNSHQLATRNAARFVPQFPDG